MSKIANQRNQDQRVQGMNRCIIYQPKVKFNGKGIKWFDDSKLLKKSKKQEVTG